MTQIKKWRSSLPSTMLILLFVLIGISASSLAQVVTTREGVDVKVHVFHPTVSPEQAAPPMAAMRSEIPGVSLGAKQQMAALFVEKQARTTVQRKIDSKVLNTVRMLQGKAIASGVLYLETGVELDDQNNLLVDIVGTVSDSLLNQLTGLGGKIINSVPEYDSIRALVPANQIEQVANWPEVRRIWPRQQATFNSIASGGTWLRPSFQQRAANIRASLLKALPLKASPPITTGPDTSLGQIDSQGDTTHKANVARATYGTSGAGVKIGVSSDSAQDVPQSQALAGWVRSRFFPVKSVLAPARTKERRCWRSSTTLRPTLSSTLLRARVALR